MSGRALIAIALVAIAGCLRSAPPKEQAQPPPSAVPEPEASRSEESAVTLFAASADGRHLLFGTADGGIRLFETEGPSLLSARQTDYGFAQNGSISPDGRWIAVDEVGMAGPSRVFVLDRLSLQIQQVLHGAQDRARLRFLPDSGALIGLSHGSAIRWKVAGGARARVFSPFGNPRAGQAWFAGAEPDMRVAIQEEGSGAWVLWEALTGKKLASYRPPPPGAAIIDTFVEENRPLALMEALTDAADTGRKLQIVDLMSGARIRALPPHSPLYAADTPTSEIRVLPGGSHLCARTGDRAALALYSAVDGSLVRELERPGGLISASWWLSGRNAVAAGVGHQTVLWELSSGRIRLRVWPDLLTGAPARDAAPQWMMALPDGRYAGSDDAPAHSAGATLTRDPIAVSRVLEELFPRKDTPIPGT